jgi:hypothetical protein
MNSIFRYVLIGVGLGLVGCAGVQVSTSKQPPGLAAIAPGPPRQVIIFIPQTDQAAMSWFKLFDRYPQLRMVIAMSPRFHRFDKEPLLKNKLTALLQAGRLELAMQIPNAPFLPLIINTDSAKAAIPPGTPLPKPAFNHPEDVTQIIASTKADFYKTFGDYPKGLILPQGAVSPELLKILNQLGLNWVIGALGAPSTEGAYRSGSLAVWDATPVKENPKFSVQVWDERLSGSPTLSIQTLNTWALNLTKQGVAATLPSDPNLPMQDLPSNVAWGGRTWSTGDWSPWIGTPQKNSAWNWLKKTRDALESYKNSGQASVRRLDMTFEEMYNAENANYFSGLSENPTTQATMEEREREFKATLSSVYRLMGQTPPDDLFAEVASANAPGVSASSTTVAWETLPDGRGHLTIEDAANDDHGDGHLIDPAGSKAIPGTYDLRRLEIWVSSDTLDWAVTLGAITGSSLGNFQNPGPLVDIYVDLNGQPNVGTVALLPGRGAVASASDAWEYAFCLWGSQAKLYRTRGSDTYDLTDTVPLTFENNVVHFSLPRSTIRGNPQRWGYQTLVMVYDPKSVENDPRPLISPEMLVAHRLPIYDLIDPLDQPQVQLLSDIEEGKRNDIPFVRYNNRR